VVTPAVAFVGCVAGRAIGAAAGSTFLAEYPRLARAFIYFVAVLAGAGGLWCFWSFAGALNFIRLGYRIRRLTPREHFRWAPGPKFCVYEEWVASGEIRQLPFVREILADGYPAPALFVFPTRGRGK
jgi:hypothetical protein